MPDTGLPREELLQVDFQRLTHPDDLQTDLALVQDLLAGRRSHYHLEKRYLDRDGRIIWARLSVSLVRNEHGEPLHFVSQIQDITAQRSSEQRLFESEQRSRITLDAVADLVLSVSLDGRIDYANAAAVRILAGDGALSLAGHKVQDVLALTTEYAPGSVLDVTVLLDPESNAVDLHADLLLRLGTATVPVDLTRAWLRDDEGHVRGAVGAARRHPAAGTPARSPPPGRDRSAHRTEQPPRFRGTPAAGDHPRGAHRPGCLADVHRSGPLQAGQRHLGPSGRRCRAVGGGQRAAPWRARFGRGGAVGR